jgi:hypothetical protein
MKEEALTGSEIKVDLIDGEPKASSDQDDKLMIGLDTRPATSSGLVNGPAKGIFSLFSAAKSPGIGQDGRGCNA